MAGTAQQTGEVGSGATGYTTIGEQVGMAQRMESVPPPGGVMLSASTARLVAGVAVLGEPELVRIKGAKDPVPARRLLEVASQPGWMGRFETTLVGRQWEMTTITGMLDRSMGGHGGVVCVGGPAGIGKSRLVHEAAAIARERGVEVFSVFCESHAGDISFHVVARLLRAIVGISDLDDAAARARLRDRVPDGLDPQDLVLLDDLLGIRAPDTELPSIDPAARGRRLTTLVNAMSLARTEPHRRTRRRGALVTKGHRAGRRRPHQRQLHHGVSAGVRPRDARAWRSVHGPHAGRGAACPPGRRRHVP